MFDMTADPATLPPARAAATVVVVRDGSAGIEVLLLQRSSVGAFADMWVFPGGRVDDADAGDDEQQRAESAAVREAFEEVALTIDRSQLVALSHWTPPAIAAKRYTTWFFVAPWTGEAVTIDGHEIVGSRWITPQDAIDDGLPLAPPTLVTLLTLQQASTVDGLTPFIEQRGIERFTTVAATLEGDLTLLWHGDAGYDTADASVAGPRHRMVLPTGSPMRYERTSG